MSHQHNNKISWKELHSSTASLVERLLMARRRNMWEGVLQLYRTKVENTHISYRSNPEV